MIPNTACTPADKGSTSTTLKKPKAELLVENSEESEDGTRVVIVLSRKPTAAEEDQINELLYEHCAEFVTKRSWRCAKLNLTIDIKSGEHRCHRQAVECVEEALLQNIE